MVWKSHELLIGRRFSIRHRITYIRPGICGCNGRGEGRLIVAMQMVINGYRGIRQNCIA